MKLYSTIKKERIKNDIISYISHLRLTLTKSNYYDYCGYTILSIHHDVHHVSINYSLIPGELSNNREILHEVIKSHYNVSDYTIGTSFE